MNSISNPTLDPAQAALLQRYLEENPRAAERHGISTDPGGRPLIDHLPREVAVAAASATPRLAAPPPGGQPVDATALGNKLGQASTEVGADLFAVMALLHKMAQNSRKAAREMRAADNQERFAQLQAAADKVKEAAEKNYEAAVKQAAAEIVTGVATVAAAGHSIYGTGKAMGESDEMAQKATMNKWDNRGQIVGGLGQIAAGNIKMSAAEDTRAAGQAQAQEKTDEANAQKAQDAADKEKEFMQRMEETMQDIRQKLAAMQQSNDETMRTILRA